MLKLLLLFILLVCTNAHAGYFEISGSGSYRKSSYGKDEYLVHRSGTASVAYYFWELSALELSYTKARQDDVRTEYQTRYYTTFYGADLIFTMADRKSIFQPYIKVGMAYQDKSGTYKQAGTTTELAGVKGWAPSAGVGFKFIIGQHVAIKTGIDAWSSPLSEDDVSYDYAGRVGLSFIF